MKLKTTAMLSAVSMAVLTGFASHAQDLSQASSEQSFAQWQAQLKQERNMSSQVIVTFENNQMTQALAQLSAGPMASVDSLASNEMLGSAKSMMTSLSQKTQLPMDFVQNMSTGQTVLSFGRDLKPTEMSAALAAIGGAAGVASAEVDHKRWPAAQSQPWGISRVQADQLSDAQAGAKTVCIIDSGYDINNSDLSGNQVSGTNDSGTGSWSVPGGSHGTHVAGTIAAVNNGEGVVGVLPNGKVDLHIIKVFNAEGYAFSSDLVEAIRRCKVAGADVVNMSLGGGGSSTAERNGMQGFVNDGILLVAASGNDGDASLSYPASYDAVMAVGALDENNQHAEFSQFTPQVEVSAPGEAVLSTVGLGDGRQGFITVNGVTTGDDRVVPHGRFDNTSGSFKINNINGSASGQLAACSSASGSYSCGDMTSKICVVERIGNQKGSNYPDGEAAKACTDAGAAGVVVYSNAERPGLQNPFLVDRSNTIKVPTASVNRVLGQQLVAAAGQNATVEARGNTDYAYYNGTSMATPHVAGVAALAWANNPDCTAAQVRQALKDTALDLGPAGRDDKTGYGLVQAKASSDALSSVCGSNAGGGNTGGGDTGGSNDSVLENGVAKTGVGAARGQQLAYTIEVPAGATNLKVALAGGSGDADLYVRAGSAATTSTYDCRPFRNGNNETCDFATPTAGTYHVLLNAYSTFSGSSLTATFDAPAAGGGNGGATGGTAAVNDISIARRDWKHYTIDIPAGMSTFKTTITGGTGDADLYIRRGARPTTSTYDCRPYKNGNEETCNIDNPAADTYHISIRAYSAVTGVNLSVDYQP